MASTVDFHNLIRRVIKHGETFYPVTQGFQFAVTDDADPVWYPTSGVPIPCHLTESNATDNQPYLRFHYDYTSGTRYYLPTGGGQIERIKIFCKYGSDETFTLIHEADISDEVTYDDNDYIDTITVQININTHEPEISQQIARHLDNGLSAGKKDLRPNKFKIYDSTFNDSSATMTPYESGYIYTGGEDTVTTQLEALGLDDDLSIEVLFSNITFAGETIGSVLKGPTKYRLFTEDGIVLDEGNINEGSETSTIVWKQNDSIEFTYTNNALDQQ